jgi:FkbM family methyltransferase
LDHGGWRTIALWTEALLGGNFENAESRFLLRFLQLGMTVLDIGAHHGYYTLLLSKAVGSRGKVIAFEPSPRERIRLRHHVWLNCCKNVQIESLALGSSNGEAELYLVEGAEDWCNSLRPPTVRASTKIVGVCVGSLDEYISSKGLGPIDFIKLDVEGAELDVLRGAKNLLASGKRPALLTEVYDIRTEPWGYRAHEIVRLLDQAGYLWFAVSEDGSLHRIEAHLEVYDANLVAIPKEQAKNFVAFEDEG